MHFRTCSHMTHVHVYTQGPDPGVGSPVVPDQASPEDTQISSPGGQVG